MRWTMWYNHVWSVMEQVTSFMLFCTFFYAGIGSISVWINSCVYRNNDCYMVICLHQQQWRCSATKHNNTVTEKTVCSFMSQKLIIWCLRCFCCSVNIQFSWNWSYLLRWTWFFAYVTSTHILVILEMNIIKNIQQSMQNNNTINY